MLRDLLDLSNDYPHIDNNAIPGLQLTSQETPPGGKVISGNTSAGTPFLAVLRPDGDSETMDITAFVNTHVLPLIDACAVELSKVEANNQASYFIHPNSLDLKKAVIHRLIRKIHQVRIDNDIAEATMKFHLSLAITYPETNPRTKLTTLRCAGFGIGTTMMVLQKNNGEFETLVDHTTVKDPNTGVPIDNNFNFTDETPVDVVIGRNQVFDISIEPNGKLYGIAHSDDFHQMRHTGEHHEKSNTTVVLAKNKADINKFTQLQGSDDSRFSHNVLVQIPRPEDINVNAKSLYEAEKTRFNKLIADNKNHNSIGVLILTDILNNVVKAEAIAPDYPKLTRSLAAAYNVATNPTDENFTRLRAQANEVDNTSYKVHKALAIGLLTLAAVTLVVGLALMCTGVGVVPGMVLVALVNPLLMASSFYGINVASDGEKFGKTGCLSNSKFGKFGLSRDLHKLADTQPKPVPALSV